VRNGIPHMKNSLCANVQLNRSNFDFNLKSSLTPFFHRALQLASPRGETQAVRGGIGDFVGTLQLIWTSMVGEMWGHRFTMPRPSGKMWGLCIWQSEWRLGASRVFVQLMKRFGKDLQVRTRRCMLKSLTIFFSSRTASRKFRREKELLKLKWGA